ncbi:DOPA 4,5-dioxygenase-like isoform X2 [Bradysia coprophila]|uniref:DOPA 4,5-dioxygenase-like isoform X2 n=1 Tax=Bradysia coprophila TaxID=38358 RepID=UPI00187D8930|nr:DOPA 4,5-dioxygenase-like isoform X2 [Bradysia coprophila]
MNFFISTVFAVVAFFINTQLNAEVDTSVITGYHFHTYFFQNNADSTSEALELREKIQELSTTLLAGCRLNVVNYGPRGPHLIGSYETCCNASAINPAQSFFMQNHGNLTIFLHPLTRYEVLDHTIRSMWLGKDMPLDISVLNHDLVEAPLCLPIPGIN